MKAIIKALGRALMVPALTLSLGLAAPVATLAVDCSSNDPDITQGPGGGAACAKPASGADNLFGPNGIFVTITNILLFIIGAIAVIMLIVGGIRYVVSSGDQTAVTNAKNTILYAIIGIVVAFLAYAAVNFVTGQLQQSS
jgi:hypothetical protein